MTLDDIRSEARPFPTWALKGETALCLFAAGFLGYNCEIHVLDAGLDALCVDMGGEKLDEMRALYPSSWAFVEMDAFLFLRHAEPQDVVTCDPPTNLMAETFTHLPELRALAKNHLILGINDDLTKDAILAGASVINRTSDSWWAIW
jgi:hypothetical protein